MLRVILFLSVLLAFQSHAAYQQKQTWLDPDFIQQAFIDVALKREYAAGDWQLVKWNKPINIWVDHKVGDNELHDQLTNAHLAHLADITRLPIRRVTSREQANIVWIFTQESQWREDVKREIGAGALKHMHGAICKAGFRINSVDGSIASAAVIIPVDQAREHGKLLACIVEEITQLMGLPNDTDSAFPSIFNDETPEDLLSPLDVILLRLLYEPELQSGMTEKQVKPIIKRILNRYQQQGILKQAVATAKAGELYQLIGY